MISLGLKVFSVNQAYRAHADRLSADGIIQYLEIYAVPNSLEQALSIWSNFPLPVIIHAPHFKDGINFSLKEQETENLRLAAESMRFADAFKADTVIFHPGVNGRIDETIRQMRQFADSRVVIENKPYLGNGKELYCVGSLPEEIGRVMDEVKVGFCLDFGHALCAANAWKVNHVEWINRFLKLKPRMYHLTDGDITGVYDRHDHYGEGSFPLGWLFSRIPAGARVTNEAAKASPDNLDDVRTDATEFRRLEKEFCL